VDFRLRQSDFSLDGKVMPWLGMKVTDIEALDSAFIIGSFLRKEQPVLATRFRRAVKRGAVISSLHGQTDDWLMPVAHKLIGAPSQWPELLAGVIAAVAVQKELEGIPPLKDIPAFKNIPILQTHTDIAKTLLTPGNHAIFIGNVAAQHPQLAELHSMAEWLAKHTGARLGYLVEGANTVGAYVVNGDDMALSRSASFPDKKAWLLLHAEPEMDAVNPPAAVQSLLNAKMVVVMSPYRHGADYADVMLPVSPFTETSGTCVNCEGSVRSFQAAARPLGDTRPAWKVLSALGRQLELEGFEYDSTQSVRETFLGKDAQDVRGKLNNITGLSPFYTRVDPVALERLTDIPLSLSDPIVRRATALQQTPDAVADKVWLPETFCQEHNITANMRVRVRQGDNEAMLIAVPDDSLPDNVARISAGSAASAMLGPLFCTLKVEAA
jgi:NADH-quinone oxidoreductase subunit G